MEKNKIRVRISDVDYTLVSTEPPEYIHKVAYIVDKKMTEIIKTNSRLSSAMAAILTAVNLADEQLKSLESADNLRNNVAEYDKLAAEYKEKYENCRRELLRLKSETEHKPAKASHGRKEEKESEEEPESQK